MSMSVYRTQMPTWNRVVRPGEPTRGGGGDEGLLPFSPKLLPLVEHPMVVGMGRDGVFWLLAQRLYAYLDWTFALEADIVLPVAGRLVADGYDLRAGEELSEDALRIIVDEGNHALEAWETKRNVIARTGVKPMTSFTQPSFVARLTAVEAASDARDLAMVRLVFSMVSETLVTGLLTQLPRDEQVLLPVRNAVSHHAADEARHHRVFTKLIEIAWRRWDENQRTRYAPWFADFLEAFICPDLAAAGNWLRQLGLSKADASAVIEDVYAPSILVKLLRDASEPSLRAMRKGGLFEHQCVVDAFGDKGLC